MKKNNRTRKPHFESLEERTLLAVTAGLIQQDVLPDSTAKVTWVVNTIEDSATWDTSDTILSLREAISSAYDGDTITFSSKLAGQTITLCGSALSITKEITIDASGISGITINANQKSRVFYIYVGKNKPVELSNITITGGKTAYGGGICADSYSTLTLTNCTIAGNTATDDGGGIYAYDSSTLTLTNCTIAENTASSSGGGIYANSSSTLTLTNCTIAENTASSSGGGIYANSSSTLTLTNCIIAENTASSSGGGIYASWNSTLTLTNGTITGNTAKYDGGGIYITGGTLTFYNTIIAQNTATSSGSDVYKESGTLNACNTLSSYTSWSNNDGTNYFFDVTQPLFTSSQTGNYTLSENSQAIDKGNNSYVKTSTDLAGNTRIVNGIVDLGAYEHQGLPQLEPPTILTGTKGYYVSYGANRHRIEWLQVKNATGYEIAYSTDNKTWKTITTDASASSALITGLLYGTSVTYKLRALNTLPTGYSDWTAPITFIVCPMDINNDGDIANADRSIMETAWLKSEGDERYIYAADINGDGGIAGADRSFLSTNWLLESDDPDIAFPRPLSASLADEVFAVPDIF